MKPLEPNLFKHFAATFESRFDRNEIASFWSCRDLFEELVADQEGLRALNCELERIKSDRTYTGDWRPDHLVLHRGQGYALSIARFDRTARFIHTAPYFGLLASLDGSSLSFDRYILPAHYKNEIFDPTLRIEKQDRREVPAGDVLELRTDECIYDFMVTRPQLVLKLTTAAYHTLEWLFSRDTLSAWQANDADLRSTQLRVGIYLLGRLADSDSIEPVKGLITHPNHSVRWAAVQALGRLSRSEGVTQLERSVDDTHPHIRRAAQKALAGLRGKGVV